MSFEFRDEKDLTKRIELANKALEYLDKFKNQDCETLINDQGAYEALSFISHTAAYWFADKLDKNIFSNKGLEQIYGSILTYLNELSIKSEQFDLVYTALYLPKKDYTFNQRCAEIFSMILYSVNIIGSRNQVRLIFSFF